MKFTFGVIRFHRNAPIHKFGDILAYRKINPVISIQMKMQTYFIIIDKYRTVYMISARYLAHVLWNTNFGP